MAIKNIPSVDDATLDSEFQSAIRSLADASHTNAPLDDVAPSSNNVRDIDGLKKSVMSRVEMFRRHRVFDPTCRLVVRQLEDGTLETIRGNLRRLAIAYMRGNDVDKELLESFGIVDDIGEWESTVDDKAIVSTMLSDGRVPVAILPDTITDRQVEALRWDHDPKAQAVPLTRWELYQLVQRQIRLGESRRNVIGPRFGRSGSWAQKPIAYWTVLSVKEQDALKPMLKCKGSKEQHERGIKVQEGDITTLAALKRNAQLTPEVFSQFLDGTHPECKHVKNKRNGDSSAVVENPIASVLNAIGGKCESDILRGLFSELSESITDDEQAGKVLERYDSALKRSKVKVK